MTPLQDNTADYNTHLRLVFHGYLSTGTRYEAQTSAIVLHLRWAFQRYLFRTDLNF